MAWEESDAAAGRELADARAVAPAVHMPLLNASERTYAPTRLRPSADDELFLAGTLEREIFSKCRCGQRPAQHVWAGRRARSPLTPARVPPCDLLPVSFPHYSRSVSNADDLLEAWQRADNALRDGVPCGIAGCPAAFSSLREWEAHYATAHRHVCGTCRAAFLSDWLLMRHVQETHDTLFRVMAQRERMVRARLVLHGAPTRSQAVKQPRLLPRLHVLYGCSIYALWKVVVDGSGGPGGDAATSLTRTSFPRPSGSARGRPES